jgi:hypothetical protein
MGQKSSQANNRVQQEALSIPLWGYSKKEHRWVQKQLDKDHKKDHLDEFRVVTYNIWFSDQYQPMRFNGLCNILSKSDAHIIGLQESSFSLSVIILKLILFDV